MTTASGNHFQNVLSKISECGFLLESDPKLPSVCSVITGGPVRGSWWSHPLSQTIFQVNEKLEDHPHVLITKLVSGKVTFVHKDLWSQILAIATAQDIWQMKGLSVEARKLLKTVEESGSLRTDQIKSAGSRVTKANNPGTVARELELKLLIQAEQVHTARGAHAKILETWEEWSKRKVFVRSKMSAEEARCSMEERLQTLNAKYAGTARFPWK